MKAECIAEKANELNGRLNRQRLSFKRKSQRRYELADAEESVTISKLRDMERHLKKIERGLVRVEFNWAIEEPCKQMIGNISCKGRSYFHFSRESVAEIAHRSIKDVEWADVAQLLQCLFPDKLICSGPMGSFLVFQCRNGERIGPPLYRYGALSSRVNDCANPRQLRLIEAILGLFDLNNILPDESWDEYCKAASEAKA